MIKNKPFKPLNVPLVHLVGGSSVSELDQVVSAGHACGVVFVNIAKPVYFSEAQLCAWELGTLARCDVVIAYVDSDATLGGDFATKLGWAAQAGKFIILLEDAELSASSKKLSELMRLLANEHRRCSKALLESLTVDALKAYLAQRPLDPNARVLSDEDADGF